MKIIEVLIIVNFIMSIFLYYWLFLRPKISIGFQWSYWNNGIFALEIIWWHTPRSGTTFVSLPLWWRKQRKK